MKTSYQFFLLFSICLWTRINGEASISQDGTREAKSVEFPREDSIEGRTKSSVETSERSLTSSRSVSSFDSEAITSETARAERRRRRIKGDGEHSDDELSGGFLTYDLLYEDENGEVSSLDVEPRRTARKRKHRRNRCKKRPGCQQRNKNRRDKNRRKKNRRKNREEIGITVPPRKWFEQQTLSNYRNFERQVFVGNRSLAHFRQELAAAAARAAEAKRPADRYNESFEDFDKIPIVTRLRRTHSSPKNIERKISRKKNKSEKEKSKKNVRSRKEKSEVKHFEDEQPKDDRKTTTGATIVKIESRDHYENIRKNFTNTADKKSHNIIQILREK